MSRAGRWLRRPYARYVLSRGRGVFYVTDAAGWSFEWDAHYITRGLREFGVRADITTDPWALRRQIIQFGDRYAYLRGPFARISRDNDVFLTWFHGDPSDPDPTTQELFRLLDRAHPHPRKIIVTSEISRRTLESRAVPAERLVSIPLGVDLERFRPASQEERRKVRARLGIAEDQVCIGSFQKDGQGWEEGMEPKLSKGPDVFLEAVRLLAAVYPNLVVLLTGPSRGYVKHGLGKLDVPYLHKYLTDYHEVPLYYRALDLYLVGSRWEGGPKALLESWASGVPIVSTRVGMCADLIRHRHNGWIVDAEDARGLAEGARELIGSPELRQTCVANALDDVSGLAWEAVAERYYRELYEPIWNSSP